MTSERELQASYQSNIQIGAGGSYAGFGASFKAGTSYKESSKTFSSGARGEARATAECKMYDARNPIVPPCISDTAEYIINGWAANPTDLQLNDFFDNFGTHVLSRIDMGARFVASSSFDK